MEILSKWFCMIPNIVLYDNDLTDKQKLLYWTISSLCAEKWYCRASNEYIWDLLWVNKWTISKNIAILEQKWYIHLSLDNNYKRYIELNSLVEQGDSQNWLGGVVKNHKGGCEKSQYINIIDKNNNIIINNNTEFWENSEFLENKNSLSINNLDLKEKEKNSAKKEKEITVEINNLLEQIKNTCNELWVAYDKTKDRMFAKHILTAKEYWEFCESIKQDRVEFALNILKASVVINYWKWPLTWTMKIYQNYADVYNQTKQKSQKFQNASVDVL